MPGESGLDLLGWIRGAHPDTAVVMVTVIDDLDTAHTALEMDVYGYAIKPIDAHQLRIAVANALGRRDLEVRHRVHRAELQAAVERRTAELQAANAALRRQQAELHRRTAELEELNAALRVLLRKRDEDKAAVEERLVANVQRTIHPYLEKLQAGALTEDQRRTLSILAANIEKIVSPFVQRISAAYLDLSPAEIRVAGLIRQGRTTKEIAAILHLSPNTVMTHRYNLRRKLGLKSSKRNLRAYLATLDQ